MSCSFILFFFFVTENCLNLNKEIGGYFRKCHMHNLFPFEWLAEKLALTLVESTLGTLGITKNISQGKKRALAGLLTAIYFF